MTKDVYKRKSCRLCSSSSLIIAFSLASTPPANELLDVKQAERQETFALDLSICENCGHVQLLEVVSPIRLFENYVYVSGTSNVFVQHFLEYADFILSKFQYIDNLKILDIGSNDGTLLKHFKNKGALVLGIDPAKKISAKANSEEIETICTFFDSSNANEIKNKFGKFDVITANNVFAHIDDLGDVLKGVKSLLSDKGIFVFEVSYLVDVVEKCLFDTIYHEHLSYHSILPLRLFLEKNGMEIFEVLRVAPHGGSIRICVQVKNGNQKISSNVDEFIKYEIENKINSIECLKLLHQRIINLKSDLKVIIKNFRNQNLIIAGYGFPAKATTLMHEFDLKETDFTYVVDDNPLKQGKQTPGLRIPIYNSDYLKVNRPDVIVILAWNFSDDIVKKLKWFTDTNGIIVIPLPETKVIGGNFESL